jgi:hypothetical protein
MVNHLLVHLVSFAVLLPVVDVNYLLMDVDG